MKHEAATVVAAMPDNRILDRAIDGFRDGYCSEGNTHFEVIYLAEDDSGFRMQNKAYQITGEMNNSFIFPWQEDRTMVFINIRVRIISSCLLLPAWMWIVLISVREFLSRS